jgi:hypothetical protein
MADLTKQTIDQDGLNPSYLAANASDKFVPGDRTFLHVKNGGGSSINVTIVTPKTEGDLAVADQVVAVPNAGERLIGPFPPRLFGDDADAGKTTVNYSGTTSVTAAVFELD